VRLEDKCASKLSPNSNKQNSSFSLPKKKKVFGLSYEAEVSKSTTPIFSDVTTKRLTTILAYTNIAARDRICLKFSLDFQRVQTNNTDISAIQHNTFIQNRYMFRPLVLAIVISDVEVIKAETRSDFKYK
jgi:hypothetical protein